MGQCLENGVCQKVCPEGSAASLARASTAGLPISCTLGHCHNFYCRGPILILGPVLESPAQTTRVTLLDFFRKILKWPRLTNLVFRLEKCFPGDFRSEL